MRNLIVAAIAVACMASAGAAQAQFYYEDSSPTWRFFAPRNTSYIDCNIVNELPSYSRLDRNDDGYLSGWELRRMGFGRNAFNQLDMNSNGYVSRSEVRAAQRSCY